MAQAQIYVFEMNTIVELIGDAYEKVQALGYMIHQFGGALRRMQDQVPTNFRIIYTPEADNNGILLDSM